MEASDWLRLVEAAPLHLNSSKTLDEYNDEEALRRLVPLIYLGMLLILGVIGNILVLIVYPLRFPRNTHRTFIVGLAIVDLSVCLITVPFETIEMRFQYTFYNEPACKTFRSFSYLVSLCSMLVLMGMSYEKYRRICYPLKKQMTVKSCRIYIVCVLLFSSLFAWPNFLLSGIRHVRLGNNVTGHDCSMSDKYAKTSFPIIAEGTLLIFSVVCILSLIILYSLIGRTILIQNRFRKHFQSHSNFTDKQSTRISVIDEINARNSYFPNEQKNCTTRKPVQNTGKDKSTSSRKLTKIAFVVSIVFIFSYLPHLIISLLTAVKGEFLLPPGPIVSALMPIVARSFIINNVANPIIYGFMDLRFRKNCILFFKCKYILFCRIKNKG